MNVPASTTASRTASHTPPHTIKVTVHNFLEEYGTWEALWTRVWKVGRSDKKEPLASDSEINWTLPTSRVHLILDDPNLTSLEREAFIRARNLFKVTMNYITFVNDHAFFACNFLAEVVAPNAMTVGPKAFWFNERLFHVELPACTKFRTWTFGGCYNLRSVLTHPEVGVDAATFFQCLSLEVLAAATQHEVNNGHKVGILLGSSTGGYRNDPSLGIVNYLKWRMAMDENKDIYLTITGMLLLSTKLNSAGLPRASPCEKFTKFLFYAGSGDIARVILSFLGMKRGEGDFRGAPKHQLLQVGLQLGALKKESNWVNKEFWGVRVNEEGNLEGNIRLPGGGGAI